MSIMKRMFLQLSSTIPPTSTKQPTIIEHKNTEDIICDTDIP